MATTMNNYKNYLLGSGFVLLGPLGYGGHATVHLAQDVRKNGRLVAIKLLDRGPDRINKYVVREVVNHRVLLHAHIVQLLQVTLAPKHLALVLEYCPGGTLLDYVRKKVQVCPETGLRKGIEEQEARWFFQQIVLALDYLHQRKFASRDLKAENVLLDKSVRPLVKLCDFGYSKREGSHSPAASRVGTIAYLAPEVVMTNAQYDAKACDMWSLGVILYIMLTAQLPFDGRSGMVRCLMALQGAQGAPHGAPEGPVQVPLDPAQVEQAMMQQILRTEYQLPAYVSDGARDLLNKILVRRPQDRPPVQDVMQHPWFAEGLPPGALAMNSQIHQDTRPGMQTEQDILTILSQASLPVQNEFAAYADLLPPEELPV